MFVPAVHVAFLYFRPIDLIPSGLIETSPRIRHDSCHDAFEEDGAMRPVDSVHEQSLPHHDGDTRIKRAHTSPFLIMLLGLLPPARAHTNDSAPTPPIGPHEMESYFRHAQDAGLNTTHAVLMALAWVIALPLAIMLSTARSRYSWAAHALFHLFNTLGLLMGIVYSASTPDLYPGNAHKGLGWAAVSLTVVWSAAYFYVGYRDKRRPQVLGDRRPLLPIQDAFHDQRPGGSNASEGGMARHWTSSLDKDSTDSEDERDPELPPEDERLDSNEDRRSATTTLPQRPSRMKTLLGSQRSLKTLRFIQTLLSTLLLPLGFATLASGLIVTGGLFRGNEVFNGVAHTIKGGIFVWYGILTLGRWMGAFSEVGWAWNMRPQNVSSWKKRVPSAEFTESFVIWAYGASNVFLEHLSNWGGKWAASDLEHLSITVLFFGGGLFGMLIESRRIRDLMSTTVEMLEQSPEPERTISLNPMPGLTIMLLGIMMSSHQQESMVSTMLHAQWGNLFTAFALARGVTYITLYLRPPTSICPSRPPSEIVASFCLFAGGVLFMCSAADVVWAIESNGFDAMAVFTVVMGLTGIVLAWEVVLFAIKGWATRKEQGMMLQKRPLASC